MMSYPCIEVSCGKCGSLISRIIQLKAIRDLLRPHNGRCKFCGNSLSSTDFIINMNEQ
jgi:hypothetical protein